MDEEKKSESHLTSAAAFVEGGIQDACEDACSICLEQFCDSDPSTVTSCKHEFHLQCILEWCQRSSQCPMCWQPISLKDPASQELLEGVERERNFRLNQSRNTTIFHHPTLGDFELQHLPVGANDSELEERIIQHLAAAAAMGRAHHFARREGHWSRAGSHGRPQFLVFSAHPNAPAVGPMSAVPRASASESSPTVAVLTPAAPLSSVEEEPQHGSLSQTPPRQVDQIPNSAAAMATNISNRLSMSNNRSGSSHSSPVSHDRAGPSDFHSFSESLKSRFNAVSTRYKETISKTTRGWRERLFSRNSPVQDANSEARRDANTGIANLSNMMERLRASETDRASEASVSESTEGSSVIPQENSTPTNVQVIEEDHPSTPPTNVNAATCAAISGPN
ncbi:E3 ubiquitin-protein ligase RHF2A isoform X2 [Nymphaea colorata]|nr:E3 ubiquitin-protein ligase RHF2A isoform X2 [Nymphaea colorata]XP_031485250.1 E3 ubiquitin-protein ligase RHF2A isoform X2 [Nymphaea colorata]